MENGAMVVMQGQAGSRLVIKWHEIDPYEDPQFPFSTSTHFASLEEFFRQHPAETLTWYEVKGQPRVFLPQ
jgi:hypothetical protein